MPRRRLHADDVILDAARDLVVVGGPDAATTALISARSGAPIGSLYHRFGSRGQLLAEVWLRTGRRFQEGLLAAGPGDEPLDRAVAAADWMVEFALRHPEDARLLLTTSEADLLGSAELPEPLRQQLAGLNQRVVALVRRLALDLFGTASAARVEQVTLAIVDVPAAVVRRHLRSARSLRAHRDLVARAARSVLVS